MNNIPQESIGNLECDRLLSFIAHASFGVISLDSFRVLIPHFLSLSSEICLFSLSSLNFNKMDYCSTEEYKWSLKYDHPSCLWTENEGIL